MLRHKIKSKDTIKKDLGFSQKVYDFDHEIRNSLPSIEAFKQEIIDMLNNHVNN